MERIDLCQFHVGHSETWLENPPRFSPIENLRPFVSQMSLGCRSCRDDAGYPKTKTAGEEKHQLDPGRGRRR